MCHAQEAARIIFMVHDEVKDKMFELGRLYTTYLQLNTVYTRFYFVNKISEISKVWKTLQTA
jgi:hypothetical protein